jgi:hypothetical protein
MVAPKPKCRVTSIVWIFAGTLAAATAVRLGKIGEQLLARRAVVECRQEGCEALCARIEIAQQAFLSFAMRRDFFRSPLFAGSLSHLGIRMIDSQILAFVRPPAQIRFRGFLS